MSSGSGLLFLALTISVLFGDGFCAIKKRPLTHKLIPSGHKSPDAYGIVAVCRVLVILVIVSTVVDEAVNLFKFIRGTKQDSSSSAPKSKASPLDLVTAYSLSRNISSLMSTKDIPDSISCLHGVRVISTMWIIIQHIFPAIAPTNKYLALYALNGAFRVDSFFFITAVLVAYRNLSDMKKKNGRFSFFYYYIHRYLSLTPSLAFVMLSLNLLAAYCPSVNIGDFHRHCEKYWWTNLFYINNFHPRFQEVCLPWTWYLACDMQFYILSPLFILAVYSRPLLGLGIALTAMVSGLSYTGYLTYLYNIPSNSVYGATSAYMNLLYLKPWMHAGPYTVGLVLGYCLHKKVKFPFSGRKNFVLYLLCLVAAVSILISLTSQFPPKYNDVMNNFLYATFSRLAWGIALALLVFTCHNGYGWYINSFLSMPFWIPLGKMSYNVYLVHYLVLRWYNIKRYSGTHDYSCIPDVIVLSFIAAAGVCVLVEFPCRRVESLLVKVFRCKDCNMSVGLTKDDGTTANSKIV